MNANTVVESVAKVLIINNKNEALVLVLGKDLKYPEKSYLPDLPGGIVDPGEHEQAAVSREAKEDCGIAIDAKDVQLTCAETDYYEEENKSVSKLLYVAQIYNVPKITLSWEHSDFKWVPIKELHTIEFRPFFKKAIEYVVAKG